MTPTPVIQLLQNKILPYACDDVAKRIIVARPAMGKSDLPEGVEFRKRKMKGRRVIVKAQRLYANTRVVQAAWPAMGMMEAVNTKIICVTAGRTAYPVGDSVLYLTAGFFLFVPPGVPHSDGILSHTENNNESCELFHLMTYPGAMQCWSCLTENGINSGDPCENVLVRESKTVSLFRALTEEILEEKRGNPEITGHLMPVLFQMLLRDLLDGRYLANSTMTYAKSGDKDGEFSAALHDYIRHRLGLPLTLEMAASHMALSRAQFARCVKQETGKTFVEILTECRLESAKTLLRESEWTAATIAEMVGYKSADYFYRLFTQHVENSPSRYREITRKSPSGK